MSRTRLIKPALFENELLGQMEGDMVLTFIGLWCVADREGRLEDRPLRLKAKLFPYRQVSIENALSQLTEGGFLIRYQVNDEAFIEIVNFLKHQHPHHKEQASDIPPVPDNLRAKEGRSTGLAPTKESSCPSLTLNPSPDTLTFNPSSPDGEQEVSIAHAVEAKASKPKRARSSPENDPHFTAFWEAYPRKVNKQGAFIAWRKAKLPMIANIIAALNAQAESEQWQKEGGKFIPNPSTWLQGERWNDELKPARKASIFADF